MQTEYEMLSKSPFCVGLAVAVLLAIATTWSVEATADELYQPTSVQQMSLSHSGFFEGDKKKEW